MIEILTTAEMADADRLAMAAGIAGIDLMQNAGRAVADHVAAGHPTGASIIVVAGPGNNGGDGFIAARILAERGYRVRLLFAGSLDRLTGDAVLAAQRWTGPIVAATPDALDAAHEPADAIVDARSEERRVGKECRL